MYRIYVRDGSEDDWECVARRETIEAIQTDLETIANMPGYLLCQYQIEAPSGERIETGKFSSR